MVAAWKSQLIISVIVRVAHGVPSATSMKLQAPERALRDTCSTQIDATLHITEKCNAIPDGTGYIRVDMGVFTDYFKPAAGYTLCEMLSSKDKHEWSHDGATWVQPVYYHASNGLGGSFPNWPRDNVAGDTRMFLSFWGSSANNPSGCCVSTADGAISWGQQYTMFACASGGAAAVGDPHLQNVYGERFDLMKTGKHVLINIPRGESADKALLRVEADARQLGGQCADLYFQELNVTGSWAEAKQAGGFHHSVLQRDVETPGWVAFEKVELKVVHGRTDGGLLYLNFYVKHLRRAGFAIGGLLGEDDHEGVTTPAESCVKKMALARDQEGDRPFLASLAAASFE